ncbi:MAG: Fructose-1,6-bisphosphatase [Watsoniomyces obsoletus]|nr:MAG: Fructose-1,6-bisphosphatase [Watsoniomyces obsoletus]
MASIAVKTSIMVNMIPTTFSLLLLLMLSVSCLASPMETLPSVLGSSASLGGGGSPPMLLSKSEPSSPGQCPKPPGYDSKAGRIISVSPPRGLQLKAILSTDRGTVRYPCDKYTGQLDLKKPTGYADLYDYGYHLKTRGRGKVGKIPTNKETPKLPKSLLVGFVRHRVPGSLQDVFKRADDGTTLLEAHAHPISTPPGMPWEEYHRFEPAEGAGASGGMLQRIIWRVYTKGGIPTMGEMRCTGAVAIPYSAIYLVFDPPGVSWPSKGGQPLCESRRG